MTSDPSVKARLDALTSGLTRAASTGQNEIERTWRLWGELERVQRRLTGRRRRSTST